MKKLFFILAITVGLISCKKETQSEIDENLIQQYLAEHDDINALRHSSGIYYEIIKNGDLDNRPSSYSIVYVRYEGYLTDGTVFDDNDGGIAKFDLSYLINGWRYGLPLIGKGGKIKLIIPSTLGYGSTEQSSIPANSIIVFDIELVDLE